MNITNGTPSVSLVQQIEALHQRLGKAREIVAAGSSISHTWAGSPLHCPSQQGQLLFGQWRVHLPRCPGKGRHP
jgi:hypothetical protein